MTTAHEVSLVAALCAATLPAASATHGRLPVKAGEVRATCGQVAEYRTMASSAARAAAAMETMKDLELATHDPSRVDRPGQARWMRAKIKLQREFAGMLLRHAEDSEKALADIGGQPRRPP